MNFLTQFAAETTTTDGDIFAALGIDWRLLILQIVAFLILVVLLGKFVYPWLMKSVDERQQKIDEANDAAAKAQKAAAQQQADLAELLATARKEAADIVSTAKLEAAEMTATTEKKAREAAEKITEAAHQQIEKDVEKARKDLHNDTIELVALATEKIVGAKVSKTVDDELIKSALKEVK